ncbi:DNA replication and repair protein RecF, partial [bacterium]|nr:DNA replication and repair protein RecF [bacterium]
MRLQRMTCTNFRSFDKKSVTFDQKKLVFIEGDNGSGKTSLLEAMYYSCFLRSFRCASPKQMVKFDQQAFHISLALEDDQGQPLTIEVGFSADKRIVKMNGKAVESFKELVDHYRVVLMTEDDLSLVTGSPEQRRSFLDHGLLLIEADYPQQVRTYKKILEQRNAFLYQGGNPSNEHGTVWTRKLWDQARLIQQARAGLLAKCQERVNKLIQRYFDDPITIKCSYQPKRYNQQQSYQEFLDSSIALFEQEKRFGRSQFGSHLDDVLITFANKRSRLYASRGQQKLIALLLKIGLLQEITDRRGPTLLLLDDFITDFDPTRQKQLAKLIYELDT